MGATLSSEIQFLQKMQMTSGWPISRGRGRGGVPAEGLLAAEMEDGEELTTGPMG